MPQGHFPKGFWTAQKSQKNFREPSPVETFYLMAHCHMILVEHECAKRVASLLQLGTMTWPQPQPHPQPHSTASGGGLLKYVIIL